MVPTTVPGVPSTPSPAEPTVARILELVMGISGIVIPDRSRRMMEGRIQRRIAGLRLDPDRYFHLVRKPGAEQTTLLDLMCTNHTFWWRESDHFADLQNRALPVVGQDALDQGTTVSIWSAGTSSGDEAYSIALCLLKRAPPFDQVPVRILGTDLSARALEAARQGRYSDQAVAQLQPADQALAVTRTRTGHSRPWQVRDELKRHVQFARLNLIDEWPMHGTFDIIFCRNVLIYFDLATRHAVLSRLLARLGRHGTLYLGHADGIPDAGFGLKHVESGIYTL